MAAMRLGMPVQIFAVATLAARMFYALPAAASGPPLFSRETKLEDASAEAGEMFGNAVSTDGTSIVVGAPFGADGSAHVYVRQGASWALQQDLLPDPGSAGSFGNAVAIDANTTAIGAYADSTVAGGAGALYVFRGSGTSWSFQQKIFAPDAASFDSFGQAVALSGNTIAVGAPLSSPRGSISGSVYIFTRNGTTWFLEQKIVPTDGAAGARFGGSVALQQDTLVGGVDGATRAAYVYVRTGSTWSLQQKLSATGGANGDGFGNSVALDGDTVVVGAPYDPSHGGAAYVFTRLDTVWTQQQKVFASNGVNLDTFGFSVAVKEGRVVVGTPGNPGGSAVGAAYVFDFIGTVWSQTQKVVASDNAVNDNLGWSVALGWNAAAIGARSKSDQAPAGGAIYVLEPEVSVPALGRNEWAFGAFLLFAGLLALRRQAARAATASIGVHRA